MADRALIAAHGKVLALLAALLDRAGVVDASEFGAMLSAFSDLDDDPDQQAILAAWADAIDDTAGLREPPR